MCDDGEIIERKARSERRTGQRVTVRVCCVDARVSAIVHGRAGEKTAEGGEENRKGKCKHTYRQYVSRARSFDYRLSRTIVTSGRSVGAFDFL